MLCDCVPILSLPPTRHYHAAAKQMKRPRKRKPGEKPRASDAERLKVRRICDFCPESSRPSYPYHAAAGRPGFAEHSIALSGASSPK